MSRNRWTTGVGQVAFLWCLALASAAVAQNDRDLRLIDAVRQGDEQKLQALLAAQVDVNQVQGDGMTALHWAVSNDDHHMTRVLLAAGARVNASTRLEAQTPLLIACSNGSAGMIRLLLDAGAGINTANALGTTPLMKATDRKSVV